MSRKLANVNSSDGKETNQTSELMKRRRVNTRVRLIEAADRLFLTRRTTALSIDDLCREAGLSRGAYYSNFSSMEDVFFAVYERHTQRILANLADSTAAPQRRITSAGEGSLESVVDCMMDVIPAEFEWYALRSTFALRAEVDPEIAEALATHAEQFRAGLTPYIVTALAGVGIEFDTDEAEAVRMIIAAHVGAVLQTPLVDDPNELRQRTLLAVIRGLIRP